MHSQVRFARVLLAPILLLWSPGVAGQSVANWKQQAINTVMDYRSSVLGDTVAKFDGCSVARELGAAPEDVVAIFAEPVRGMLAADCVAAAERGARKVVLVDSVTRHGDDVVRAYVTVVVGEWVHREDYALVIHTSEPPLMAVREVRVWGAVQSYPRRPPRNAGR